MQWPVYNSEDGSGAIRYLVARHGYYSNQTLLVIVSSQPRLPKVREFVDIVRKRVRSLCGVVLNLNPHRTNVILGTRNSVLWGSDHIVEEVAGLKFNISANSFFQVNIEGLETIYSQLDQFLQIQPRDTILDAYCGVGSLALLEETLPKYGVVWVVIDNNTQYINDSKLKKVCKSYSDKRRTVYGNQYSSKGTSLPSDLLQTNDFVANAARSNVELSQPLRSRILKMHFVQLGKNHKQESRAKGRMVKKWNPGSR